MVKRSKNLGRRRNTVICEAVEPRLFLSAAATATADPYTVLKAGMATPDSYSNPNGAPLTPAKMRDAYGLGPVGNSNVTFNGIQGDGTGQTIALIEGGDDPDISADLTAFDSYWGLPAPPKFQQLNDTGGTTLPGAGDVGELDLDVEWAHVMAPGASLIVYCGNLYTGITTALNAPDVAAISVSYTITGTVSDSEFETPAGHTGVTVLASAGDTAGEVNEPAKSASVVAVGGTDLYLSGTAYSSESAWSDSGGGINTGETQPAYQNGVVSAWSTTNRTTPDVSADADPSTGVAVYNEYDNGTTDPWSAIIGGTSLSSPLMAGVIAVADQGRVAAGLTALDGYTQTLPRLYKLSSADFHDITTGNNTHAATAGYDLASGIGSPIANKLIPDLDGADIITGTVYIDTAGTGGYVSGDTLLTGKTVYLDLNDNGVQDAGEPTATTNSAGIYTFSDQIGSETGVVRLASPPTGDLSSLTLTTFTTSYDQTQTVNLAFYPSTYTAVANPTTVTGTTTALSVSGANPSDASTFTYTWSATGLPTGATAPTFSANGTNAAKTSTATFTKAGNYTFTLTVTDSYGNTVTSSVNVTVTAKVTALTDGGITALAGGSSLQYTATDQFGNAVTGIGWSVSGGGTISSSGLLTASQAGGTYSVSANYGATLLTAGITIVPTIYTDPAGGDTYTVRLSAGNPLLEQIWVNIPETATPTYTIARLQLPSLSFTPTGGDGSLTIDYANGNPIPVGDLLYQGGPNATASGNALFMKGAAGGSSSFNIGAGAISNTAFGSTPIDFSDLQSIEFDLLGGSNTLTQTAAVATALTYNAGAGSNTLNVDGGTFTFTKDPQTGSGNLAVNDNTAVTFAAGAAGSGFNARHLTALTLGPGATAALQSPASTTDRTVLELGSLTIAATGQLDLGNNDVIVHNGNIAALTALLTTGDNNSAWNGDGIDSSAAAGDPSHLAAVGSLLNTNGRSAIYSTFDNQPAVATDVLIKYTTIGDANLDGLVDGSDFTKIDNGFNNHLTGWLNGDFNYDGQVDASDYTLIDNAFNTQSASMASTVAAASQIAVPSKSTSTATTPREESVPPIPVSMPWSKHRPVPSADIHMTSDLLQTL